MTSIYTLTDPRKPEDIRYIGKTSQALKRRLSVHCADLKGTDHRTNWIKSLLNAGVKPTINQIATVLNEQDTAHVEIICIQQFKSFGYNLVNSTNGGDGVSKHSAETRAKISASKMGTKHPYFGKHLSLEHRTKIGAASKGRKHTEKTKHFISETYKGKNNPFFGRKHTPETRAKMSEAQKGNTHKKDYLKAKGLV